MVRSKRLLWLCGLMLVLMAPAWAVEDLFIETELSPPDPYIQAPVEYRIRLYRALTLSQGSLILPEQEQLVAELLEEVPSHNVQREGRLYQLQEWRYLLFPQRSGKLVVEAPVFSGRQAFGRGHELQLRVRPPPMGAPWIPAYGLTLSEQWRNPEPPWQVGDLLERTITIEAQGVTGAQLPALPAPAIAGMELQELGAEVSQHVVDGQLIGRRVQRQRLLASQAGRFVLPDSRLVWWDLAQDAAREAVLPGRVLEFAAIAPPPVSTEAVAGAPVIRGSEPSFAFSSRWLVSGLAGLLLIVVGVLLHRRYLSVEGRHQYRARVFLRQVEAACRSNDAPAAAQGLLAWAAHHFGAGLWTLGQLAQRYDGEVARALWALDARLYRPAGGEWDGLGFVAVVLPALRGRHKAYQRRPDVELPPLNP